MLKNQGLGLNSEANISQVDNMEEKKILRLTETVQSAG